MALGGSTLCLGVLVKGELLAVRLGGGPGSFIHEKSLERNGHTLYLLRTIKSVLFEDPQRGV